ncbi:hypothetical protein [Kamptonema sp. UHCC 0994]|uniref:TRAFAC clade GTPase domain-containing protein n=1 Tax=Kamptonema sp. UHCC 0994 TaxID=3031329 RepID=UPI0023BACE7D|nr:hypothetical protein [Kamptonema sp. UHCC 0994]MDF0556189.1 hypothetical protein [Kamptonema sp. UHCC 0994]
MPEDYKITMLGPSGVGKTSLLTVMWDRLADTIGEASLQLTPEPESLFKLQKCLKDLKSLANRGNFQAKGGIEGTSAPSIYSFDVGNMGARNPSWRLHFHDYPGEWIESNAQNMNKVRNIIQESSAVLIAIDAPALMEREQRGKWKGEWHEEFNTPTTITTLFQQAYKGVNLPKPKIVILAPVKCEKYIRGQHSEALLERVKSGYSNLLKTLQADALAGKIAVVVAPVQTVGNVSFNAVQDQDGTPRFSFSQVGSGGYSPKNSEQPLRYLLRFLLREYNDRSRFPGDRLIRTMFDVDAPFIKAATVVAQGCKHDNGFAVLHGHNLLN